MQRHAWFYFSLLLLISISTQAQNVVNPGFENWHNLTNQNNLPYEEPVDWKTPNQYTVEPLAGSFQGVQKHASIVHSGNFSMRLSSKLVPFINKVAPGAATNGDFRLINPVTFTYEIIGGQAYTYRPEKYRGYYQYSPVTNDSCFVIVELSRWDPVNQQRNIVGRGEFSSGDPKVTWTAFEVPITYTSCDRPDTLLITISASKLDGSSGDGSIMYVDSTVLENIPSIDTQPAQVTTCDGQGVNFNFSTSGTGLSYQWQEDAGNGFMDLTDGGIYDNSQTNSLDISSVVTTMSGYRYRCIVSKGSCSIDTTQAAFLQVNAPHQITNHPTFVTACIGDSVGFEITATGGQLTYQWQSDAGGSFSNLSNGSTYQGATSARLTINPVAANMDGTSFRCIIDGPCSTPDTSRSNKIAVNSVTIDQQPLTNTVCEGELATFTVMASGTGLIYEWQLDSGAGFMPLSNSSLYNGTDQPTLIINNADLSMNGYSYRVVVGSCNAPVISTTAFFNVRALPHIDIEPFTQRTQCEGQSLSISLVASGFGVNYQWQANDGNGFSNLTDGGVYANVNSSSLRLNNITGTMDGYLFRCIVSGACTPSDTSTQVLLDVLTTPTMQTQPVDIDACVGTDTTFTVAATGDSLVYQWQVDDGTGFINVTNNATYSGAGTAVLKVSNIQTTLDNNRYRCRVGICNPAVFSDFAFLTVKEQPVAGFTYQVFNDSVAFVNFSIATNSVVWDFGDGSPTATTSNPSHRYTASGDYDVTLTATSDCGVADTVVTISILITGIEDVLASQTFKLYPNPAQESFYLEPMNKQLPIEAIHLMDLQGRVIPVQWKSIAKGYQINITEQVTSGLYVIEAETPQGSWFHKLSIVAP